MNTNTEKYELATPLIYGTAIGTLCVPFGPLLTCIGFVVGAGLGYWSDKKEKDQPGSREKGPVEDDSTKSVCSQ